MRSTWDLLLGMAGTGMIVALITDWAGFHPYIVLSSAWAAAILYGVAWEADNDA